MPSLTISTAASTQQRVDGALFSNLIGYYNTANGAFALESNTTGAGNTANGFATLFGNTTGGRNTGNGCRALYDNNGNWNTANGHQALASNTTGLRNTANGCQALLDNQIGNGNTADGYQALANNTGSFNVALGFTAGANLTTGSNNIDIGTVGGVAGESGTLRIGTVKQTAAYVRGISGAIVASGATVIVGTDGHLGTVVSSERLKIEIEPMDKASEAILAKAGHVSIQARSRPRWYPAVRPYC